jgi:hypothetical protein
VPPCPVQSSSGAPPWIERDVQPTSSGLGGGVGKELGGTPFTGEECSGARLSPRALGLRSNHLVVSLVGVGTAARCRPVHGLHAAWPARRVPHPFSNAFPSCSSATHPPPCGFPLQLRSFPASGPIDEDLAREGYILASFNGQEAQPVILESAGEIGPLRISTLRNAISPGTRNFNLVTVVGARQVHNPLSVVNDVTVYGFHAGYTYTFSAGPDSVDSAPAGTYPRVSAVFFFLSRGHPVKHDGRAVYAATLRRTVSELPVCMFPRCHRGLGLPTPVQQWLWCGLGRLQRATATAPPPPSPPYPRAPSPFTLPSQRQRWLRSPATLHLPILCLLLFRKTRRSL